VPLLPLVVVGSLPELPELLPDEPVVEGTVKSCVAVVVPLVAAGALEPVSELDPLLPELPLPEPVVPVELPLVPDVVDGAMKLMPLEDEDPPPDPVTDRLPDGIAELSLVAGAPSVPNSPELNAVAEGLDPAVTVKFSVPSLEISYGAPEAGVPPSRLIPMT
jgi:hypothetical protein